MFVSVGRSSHSLPSNGGQWSSDGYSSNKVVSFCIGRRGEGVLGFGLLYENLTIWVIGFQQ